MGLPLSEGLLLLLSDPAVHVSLLSAPRSAHDCNGRYQSVTLALVSSQLLLCQVLSRSQFARFCNTRQTARSSCRGTAAIDDCGH